LPKKNDTRRDAKRAPTQSVEDREGLLSCGAATGKVCAVRKAIQWNRARRNQCVKAGG